MTPNAFTLFSKIRLFRSVLLLISVFFVLVNFSPAQVTPFNHAGLKWRTMEGQFHVIHYHVGSERTAREILNIADAVHPQLVELYHYTPDTKVHWVVYDTDDYANGATYYLNNKIIIWAPALDFEFRGSHHWLRNVVTHEYTHMIQLGAARKWSREIPGIYTQVIDYEKESRPDVLYGFPNRIVSYPVINTVVPHWFAEGTAQSMRKGMNFDFRDSHREMLLRTRSLTGNLLTLDEMGVFEKTSLGGELVYNQGFSLVQYISDRFGEASLRKLSEAMAKPMTWTLDGACRNSLGISAKELYNDWSRTIKETYAQRTATIRANEVNGRLLEEEGFGNLYPRWSNDGKSIYFVSNKKKDYFGGSKVVKYDVESGKKDKLFVTTAPFAIHPNDNAIIYSHQPLTKDQRRLNDLYWYNIDKKKSYRLTYEARVQQPDISTDGKSLVAITQSDGTSNLLLIELPDLVKKDIPRKSPLPSRTLTNYTNGEQISQPRFSPDGKSILFSLVTDENRDLIMLDVASGKTELLRESRWDDRNAAWSRDGKWIYFTSDSTGIWNVYRMSSDRTTIEPVTNVVGGALFGEPSPDGTKLAFSRYEWDGYKLALLDQITPVDRANMTYIRNYPQTIPKSAQLDTSSTKSTPEIYKPTFEKTYFLPRLAWDYGKFKPGFYAYTSDYIEKLNLFGGFAINGKADYDLYLSADYRQLPPVLFIDFYNIVRHDDKRFDDTYRIIGQRGSGSNAEPIYATYGIKYKFTLYELDIGFRYNIEENTVASLYTMMSRYNAALDFDDGTSAFGYTYFKGRSFVASLVQSAISRSVTNDIHPAGGYQFGVKVQKAQNSFIEGFTVNAEKLTLQEVYIPYNYWQIDASFDYYYKWWRDFVVAPSATVGYIDRAVDPFFHLYAGGLYGMRGYSFYSLGGTRTAIAQLKQQMPIWRPEGKKQWLGWIHPTDLYFNLFGDVGTAFRGDVEQAKWVRDAGAEIRFGAVSGYSFPTAISFAAARGLDQVTVVENNVTTVYDPDWRFYFTILFGFTQPPTGARTPSSVHNLSK